MNGSVFRYHRREGISSRTGIYNRLIHTHTLIFHLEYVGRSRSQFIYYISSHQSKTTKYTSYQQVCNIRQHKSFQFSLFRWKLANSGGPINDIHYLETTALTENTKTKNQKEYRITISQYLQKYKFHLLWLLIQYERAKR